MRLDSRSRGWKGKTHPVDRGRPDDLRETLEEQRKSRGAPPHPYLFYAQPGALPCREIFAVLTRK
jgi:hypothetical protein